MSGVERLARAITSSSATSGPAVSVATGIVYSVTAGGATDGSDLVTVTLDGVDGVPVPWLLSMGTVSVGQRVLIARSGAQLIALGRIVGTP